MDDRNAAAEGEVWDEGGRYGLRPGGGRERKRKEEGKREGRETGDW